MLQEHCPRLVGLASIVVAAAAPSLVWSEPVPRPAATQDLTALSLEELAKLRVTVVTRVPQSQAETPAAIDVVTGEEIRRAGATSFAEALRFAPGVQVARANSEQVGRRDPRLREHAVPIGAGHDRRPQRLHAALRRHVLGDPGHDARRRRPDRGGAGARRHPVGRERGERRRQPHHEERPRVAGPLRRGRRGNRGARLRRRPLRRPPGRLCRVPGLRQVLQPRSGVSPGREGLRRVAPGAGGLPPGLGHERSRQRDVPGRPLCGPPRPAPGGGAGLAALLPDRRAGCGRLRGEPPRTLAPLARRRLRSRRPGLLRPHLPRRGVPDRGARHVRRRPAAQLPSVPGPRSRLGPRLPRLGGPDHGPPGPFLRPGRPHGPALERVSPGSRSPSPATRCT